MNRRRLLRSILGGSTNVAFNDFTDLVEGFGFRLARVRASHHIYVRDDIREVVNLQPFKGQAKAYQVRQFLKLVERYNLAVEVDE